MGRPSSHAHSLRPLRHLRFSSLNGGLFSPPQNETLLYDEDGNFKEDARWHYTWDGENRLTAMEEKQIATPVPDKPHPPESAWNSPTTAKAGESAKPSINEAPRTKNQEHIGS
jgi:hypothetical protein